MNLLPFSAEMTSNYNKLLVLSHKLWILGTLFTNYLLSQYYFLYINLLFTILNTMLWPDNFLFSFFNIICIICKHTFWHLHHIQLHMYSFSVIVNWVAHLVKCCIDIGLELFSDFFFFFFFFLHCYGSKCLWAICSNYSVKTLTNSGINNWALFEWVIELFTHCFVKKILINFGIIVE